MYSKMSFIGQIYIYKRIMPTFNQQNKKKQTCLELRQKMFFSYMTPT